MRFAYRDETGIWMSCPFCSGYGRSYEGMSTTVSARCAWCDGTGELFAKPPPSKNGTYAPQFAIPRQHKGGGES